VKTELEQRDRERIASIIEPYSRIQKSAYKELKDEVGSSRLQEAAPKELPIQLIHQGDSVIVLSFLEHFFNQFYHKAVDSYDNPSERELNQVAAKIVDVLETEGLLWELYFEDDVFKFRQLESEAMEDIDKKIQALAEKEPWDKALKGYNDAFKKYLEGEYDEQIPKKLYYSIEEVLKVICVDEEGWTGNRELVHSEYLEMMKEHNFYHAHGATVAELNQFLSSLDRMVAKVSDDRKQRHAYHDRTYATLLIHQVGAYIYFLINRHKEYSS
jgi:hypothetical protein